MRYQISGKQIDIGAALQTHVETELGQTLSKYAGRPTEAYVVFSKSGHEHVAESVVHLSTGLTVQASGRDPEIYAAFDACCEKMDKQLRRYKRRLKDHHRDRPDPVAMSGGGEYILAATTDEVEDDPAEGHDAPVIVAETEAKIPSLSVGEAVMQMELSHAAVMVFRNEKQGRINVVYKRDDGNIGWIDPHDADRAATN
ncbi:ribosomal subunit interface protein [Loktanella fryxellensis]|uniref:Ribosome hibernation promoting factor n=1 Tax=Loktanella fryxellensis TaxID=245187 RepID=A0A1H8DQK1_9RHOB|nr:ribosome-associated translation inhibitor RaiA [Loktanella fryxellensis]SEN09552.1 ribosomal subunit interface protein [Loktanella fryxellensis]